GTQCRGRRGRGRAHGLGDSDRDRCRQSSLVTRPEMSTPGTPAARPRGTVPNRAAPSMPPGSRTAENVVDVDEDARSESRKHLEKEHRGIGVLKHSMGPVIKDDVDRGRETAGVNRMARELGRMARANLEILGRAAVAS